MLWLWAVMFLSVAVFGVTPSHGDVTEPTAHFGLPISLHITPSATMIKDGTYFSETPLILYQVGLGFEGELFVLDQLAIEVLMLLIFPHFHRYLQ